MSNDERNPLTEIDAIWVELCDIQTEIGVINSLLKKLKRHTHVTEKVVAEIE